MKVLPPPTPSGDFRPAWLLGFTVAVVLSVIVAAIWMWFKLRREVREINAEAEKRTVEMDTLFANFHKHGHSLDALLNEGVIDNNQYYVMRSVARQKLNIALQELHMRPWPYDTRRFS